MLTPDEIQRYRDGKFFSVNCPKCGRHVADVIHPKEGIDTSAALLERQKNDFLVKRLVEDCCKAAQSTKPRWRIEK